MTTITSTTTTKTSTTTKTTATTKITTATNPTITTSTTPKVTTTTTTAITTVKPTRKPYCYYEYWPHFYDDYDWVRQCLPQLRWADNFDFWLLCGDIFDCFNYCPRAWCYSDWKIVKKRRCYWYKRKSCSYI